MFGDKLATANERITALTALLAGAGLTINADAALPTPAAFKLTLDAAQKSAVDAAVATVTASLTTATATAGAYAAGLAAAGVKLGDFKSEDFKSAEGAKPEDLNGAASAVKTAVETAITARSAKVIAATGHSAALDVAKEGAEPQAGEAAAPETAADFLATLNVIADAGARTAYLRKHKEKFPVK